MSNLEIYTKALEDRVKELLDLINGEKFLAGSYQAGSDEIVVNDPDDAITFACDQDVDVIKGEEYQYWTNLLENHARTGEQMDKEEELGLGREFNKISETIYNERIISAINEKAESLEIPDSLIDVICGNFYNFLMNEVLLEEQSSFDKSLYDVYKKGGIPCGWKGSYPDGSMLIFSAD